APILLENIIRYKINLTKNKSVSNSPEDSNTYYATLNSDLLIIDDLGTESINTMKLTELFNIINARILNKKKTIISTNLNIHQIFTNYEERIGSRIAGYYNSYNFYGDDIRLRKYKK
ncbi:MAG: DNA replication protein DnaC, partial [Eubacteriales bacterium]